MESALISEAAKQGIWSLLFIILFVWTMKANVKREEKSDLREQKSVERELEHREFIRKLQFEISSCVSSSHQIISAVASDVDNISNKVHNISEKLEVVDRKVSEVDKKVSRIHDQIDVEDYR